MTLTETAYESLRILTSRSYACDSCGANCTDEHDHGGEPSGSLHSVDFFTRVYSKRVEVSGQGSYSMGERRALIFDLCGACFRSKVVPALAAIGLRPRVEESDW